MGSYWWQNQLLLAPVFRCDTSSVLSQDLKSVIYRFQWLCCYSVAKSRHLLATPWTGARRAALCSSIPRVCSNSSHWVGDAIQPSHPLSFPSPPAFNLSQHQGLFQCVGSSHQVAKDWSFSFSISLSNQYSGLISFRMDWFDLLAVQGTLSSLLHHHSLKASILCHSAFFMGQLSHLYMLTRKTIALTIWTFVGKVMYLLLNALSRFVIIFLQRRKCLLI